MLANTAATKYMLLRAPKAQVIVQKRFELVSKAIEMSSKHAGFASSELVTQLLDYQEGGVYGENKKGQDAPIVAHEHL